MVTVGWPFFFLDLELLPPLLLPPVLPVDATMEGRREELFETGEGIEDLEEASTSSCESEEAAVATAASMAKGFGTGTPDSRIAVPVSSCVEAIVSGVDILSAH